jgi:serine/threonine protein kinase
LELERSISHLNAAATPLTIDPVIVAEQATRDVEVRSAVGTLHFLSPEMISNEVQGKAVDWWACGIFFHYCAVRSYVFNTGDKDEVMRKILSGPIDLTELGKLSVTLMDLVQGLLNRDPQRRLGATGAQTIKYHDFFAGIDWMKISTSDAPHKPQDITQKYAGNDKALFYGDMEEEDRGVVERIRVGRRAGITSGNHGQVRWDLRTRRPRSTRNMRIAAESNNNNIAAIPQENWSVARSLRDSSRSFLVAPLGALNEHEHDGDNADNRSNEVENFQSSMNAYSGGGGNYANDD